MPFSATWLALTISAASAIHQGALKVEYDGAVLELHLVSSAAKGTIFSTSGRAMTVKWGDETRGFLASKQMDDMPAGNYHNFTLLNKEFSFDVDLSSVGCSCNAALFFVSMPGYEVNGSVARGQDQNPYYCDANKTGDVWCWEHDTLQSNKYTMATTAHVCDIQPGRYINSCDKEGCRANAFDMDPEGMGPGGYSIDTRKPFRVHQRFEANWKGKLVRIVNRMVQDGNVFTWDSCADAAYLEQMTVAFSNKMVMGFQLSGNSWKAMEWLDGMTGCTGECIPSATEVTFSEISIRSLHPVKDIVV